MISPRHVANCELNTQVLYKLMEEVGSMLYAAKSHIGLVRQMNQDNLAIHSEFQPFQLAVVADGMGGASAGEVASRLAIDEVCQFVEQALLTYHGNVEELLREAIYKANHKIWETARAEEEYTGMGTTLVAALFNHAQVTFAHVGDSRGYIFQANDLQQVTNDHSLVAELVRRGQLTEEEALHHPQRNIVTRSLGTSETNFPDVRQVKWQEGDVFMLCTDGLTNLVTQAELMQHLHLATAAKSNAEVEKVADSLIELALVRGGSDNITLVLVLHREGERS